MSLTEIIQNAAVGFTVGFTWGAVGSMDKNKEKLEVVEATIPKERREELGITEERVKKIRKHHAIDTVLWPALFGTLFSTVENLSRHEPYLQNMAVLIPSAYIGGLAGRAVRKLVRVKRKRELKTAQNIIQDPENALDYVSPSERAAVESSLGEIENMIIDGSFNDEKLKNSIGKMYDAAKNKLYLPTLREWSHTKLDDIIKTAPVQKEIAAFYKESNLMGAAIIGKPEKTSLMIYELNGTDLKVYSAAFSNLRVMSISGDKIVVAGSSPRLELKDTKNWKGDYRALTKELMDAQPAHTTMLLKTTPEVQEQTRLSMVTETFVTAFSLYKREKGEKDYHSPFHPPANPLLN